MDIKSQILNLLFINDEPTENQKNLIDIIINLTKKKLLAKLPNETNEIPEILEYIIVEIAIKRFNKIGSEGMSKETVEGHSMEFGSDDFKEYADDIQKYIDSVEDDKRKKLYFL